VSRQHASLRKDGDALVLVDAGSRNRTLVNGKPVTEHRLQDGDEITVGKTLLAYLPPEGDVAVLPAAAIARVTLEVSTDELLRKPRADARATRPLGQLARLGDGLRRSADRAALLALCCEVVRDSLDADRAVVLLPDASGRLAPAAAA